MRPPPAATAERILHGGPILTMETSQPRAEDLAIGSGEILEVGQTAPTTIRAQC